MGLNLGVDFGTATTSVATVDRLRADPTVIPMHGRAFLDSLVWLDAHSGTLPVLDGLAHPPSLPGGRSPKALWEEAQRRFDKYWVDRVAAYGDFHRKVAWEQAGRESWMLLSYFKPELADNPPIAYTGTAISHDRYDPLSQSSEVTYTWFLSRLATPAPTTADFVTGTAALLRDAVRLACEQRQERVDSLLIGLPSMDSRTDPSAAALARERRLEAIDLAGIASSFGTPQFGVDFCSESFAAAAGLHLETDVHDPHVIVVDVGAGTTDCGVVRFERGSLGRWEAMEELVHASFRIAGRDINVALATHLHEQNHLIGVYRALYRAIDERAWQLLLDRELESVKRNLGEQSRRFPIRLSRVGAVAPGISALDADVLELQKEHSFHLSLGDLRGQRFRFGHDWKRAFGAFLNSLSGTIGSTVHRICAVELVGGACRFPLIEEYVREILGQTDFRGLPVRFRGEEEARQTAVARGLAWRASPRRTRSAIAVRGAQANPDVSGPDKRATLATRAAVLNALSTGAFDNNALNALAGLAESGELLATHGVLGGLLRKSGDGCDLQSALRVVLASCDDLTGDWLRLLDACLVARQPAWGESIRALVAAHPAARHQLWEQMLLSWPSDEVVAAIEGVLAAESPARSQQNPIP